MVSLVGREIEPGASSRSWVVILCYPLQVSDLTILYVQDRVEVKVDSGDFYIVREWVGPVGGSKVWECFPTVSFFDCRPGHRPHPHLLQGYPGGVNPRHVPRPSLILRTGTDGCLGREVAIEPGHPDRFGRLWTAQWVSFDLLGPRARPRVSHHGLTRTTPQPTREI